MKNDANKALLVLSRNPTGPRTGRIAVLETAVRGLKESGVDVRVVAVTSENGPSRWLGVPVTRIAPQSTASTIVAAGRAVLSRRTLNSAVFDNREIKNQVARAAREFGAGVIVVDGLRAFNIAQIDGLPIITHLDDLLSNRYGSTDFVKGNDSILGYYGKELPVWARRAAENVLRRTMRVEARRAYAAEIDIAKSSAVTAMTSLEEAAELSRRSGQAIEFLPMGVEVAASANPGDAPANSAVFVGALHYGPNISALRFLRDDVLPILRNNGRAFVIDIVGLIGDNDLSEFDDVPEFCFKDYAPDLVEALANHRMLLSPVTAGTGVKTKALDGMSVSLPVVATTLGIAGVPGVDGESVLIADTAKEYASAMSRLMDDAVLAARIGENGRGILETEITNDAVQRRWGSAFQAAAKATK